MVGSGQYLLVMVNIVNTNATRHISSCVLYNQYDTNKVKGQMNVSKLTYVYERMLPVCVFNVCIACMCVCIDAHVCVCGCVCLYVYICVCMYMCVYTCIRACMFVCTRGGI